MDEEPKRAGGELFHSTDRGSQDRPVQARSEIRRQTRVFDGRAQMIKTILEGSELRNVRHCRSGPGRQAAVAGMNAAQQEFKHFTGVLRTLPIRRKSL